MAAHTSLGRDVKIFVKGCSVVVIRSRDPVEIDACDAMARDAAVLGVLLFDVSDEELKAIHTQLGPGSKMGR